MATTTVKHGQLSQVDEDGNVLVLQPENDGTDVKVDRTANTVGTSGASAIPSDVDNVQKLVNKMGALAFKTNIGTSDFSSGVVTQDLNVTASGKVLDGRVGKTLNDKIVNLEDAPLVAYQEQDDGSVVPPESEINDSLTSAALTWSSKKLSDELTQLNSNHEQIKKSVDSITLSLSEIIKFLPTNSFVQNSDSVITQLLKCADTYMNNISKLYYGNYYTATDLSHSVSDGLSNGKYQIDCSSFVELVMSGCSFEASRYSGNTYNTTNMGYGYRYYNTINDSVEGSIRYTYDLAEWCYNHGLMFKMNNDFTNLQAGDLVFTSSGTKNLDKFMKIDHVAIYIGKTGSLDYLTFYEVRDEENVIQITQRTQDYISEYGVCAVRFPLGISTSDIERCNISLPAQTIQASKTYTYICESIDNGEWITVIVNATGVKNAHIGFKADIQRVFKNFSINGPVILSYTFKSTKSFNSVIINAEDSSVTINDCAVYRGYKSILSTSKNEYIQDLGDISFNSSNVTLLTNSQLNKNTIYKCNFTDKTDLGNCYVSIFKTYEMYYELIYSIKSGRIFTLDSSHNTELSTIANTSDNYVIGTGEVSLTITTDDTTATTTINKNIGTSNYAVIVTLIREYPSNIFVSNFNRTSTGFGIAIYGKSGTYKVQYIICRL